MNIKNPFRRDKPEKLYPTKALVQVTTEVDGVLLPCKVLPDHQIEYREKLTDLNKRNAKINPDIPAMALEIPLRKIAPGPFYRKLLMPKKHVYRVYTIRKEGEMTHDPHNDGLDGSSRINIEESLKLIGTAGKTKFADNIMKGMPKKKGWEDMIPIIAIVVIVIAFLFAFQIQPNM